MSVMEEKATWVKPYRRRDGTLVSGYWRGRVLVEWPIMPDYVDPSNMLAVLRGSDKLLEPGSYAPEEVFAGLFHENDPIRDEVREALAWVSKTHQFESTEEAPLAVIPILHPAPPDDKQGIGASYFSTPLSPDFTDSEDPAKPVAITVWNHADSEAEAGTVGYNYKSSIIHEVGHYIDQQMFGGDRRQFASTRAIEEQDGPLVDVMDAIWTSGPMRQLYRMLADGKEFGFPSYITNIGIIHVREDFIEYLMTPTEAFARAYQQYILEDDPDPVIRHQHNLLTNDNHNLYPQQWTPEEFSHIRDAFDRLFGVARKDGKAIGEPFEEQEHPRDTEGRFREKWPFPRHNPKIPQWPESEPVEDWLAPVEWAKRQKFPTANQLEFGNYVRVFPEWLRESALEKFADGDPLRWDKLVGDWLDERPVGSTMKVEGYPSFMRSGTYTSHASWYRKREDGKWERVDELDKEGNFDYDDWREFLIEHLPTGQAIANASTEHEFPESPPLPYTISDKLELVMQAGRAIHGEIGRRLRERGFGDSPPESRRAEIEKTKEKMKNKNRKAQEKLHDVWMVETKRILKERFGVEHPEDYWDTFDAFWRMPYISGLRFPKEIRDIALEEIKMSADEAKMVPAVAKARKAQEDSDFEYAFVYLEPSIPGRSADFKQRREVAFEVLKETRGFGNAKLKVAYGSDGRAEATKAAKWLPDDWIESSNKNPDGVKLKVLESGGRGFYRPATGEAVVSKRASRVTDDGPYHSVAVHELVHRMEHARTELSALEWAYYRKRTGDEELVNLDLLVPGSGYLPGERSRPDKWVDVYTGKDYGNRPDSAYEILTMGIQDLVTGSNGSISYDADHAQFVLGVLATV